MSYFPRLRKILRLLRGILRAGRVGCWVHRPIVADDWESISSPPTAKIGCAITFFYVRIRSRRIDWRVREAQWSWGYAFSYPVSCAYPAYSRFPGAQNISFPPSRETSDFLMPDVGLDIYFLPCKDKALDSKW